MRLLGVGTAAAAAAAAAVVAFRSRKAGDPAETDGTIRSAHVLHLLPTVFAEGGSAQARREAVCKAVEMNSRVKLKQWIEDIQGLGPARRPQSTRQGQDGAPDQCDTVNCIALERTHRTVLSLAAGRGLTPLVRLLVEHGADPEIRDKHNLSAVEYATMGHHTAVVEYLVTEGGCDMASTAPDMFGLHPLHKAAGFGHADIVQVLLDAGTDVNRCTGDITAPAAYEAKTYHETALGIAARRGQLAVVEVLLQHPEVDVNRADDLGDTPLSQACYHHHWRITKRLLAAGAQLGTRNAKGQQPLDRTYGLFKTLVGSSLLLGLPDFLMPGVA